MNSLTRWLIILLVLVVGNPVILWAEEKSPDQEIIEESQSQSPSDDPYFREMFGQLIPTLDETLELHDLHPELPDRTFLYGKDKRANQADINELLDTAIEILNISDVDHDRKAIRNLQEQIKESYLNIARLREQRLSAPRQSSMGTIGRINPLSKSKENYDELIAEEEATIAECRRKIEDIKFQFAQRLREMGLSISDQGVESLLSSVAGDDFIRVANVFDNLKQVTEQLQVLTRDSGESLEIAKRYYGMYVVLNEILDRIQKQFIITVEDEHIPKLQQYIQQASANIVEAQNLLEASPRDAGTLKQNIESNQLTIKAAQIYINYLQKQADMIASENMQVERNLATARNTYKTVKVSSNVAELIQNGRERFETLMQLNMPQLQGFENSVLREEFERLTQEIETGGRY